MSEVMRKGDRTSTGGVVVQGNGTVQHQGKAVTSIGMEATCPACKKGRGPIVPVGPRTVHLPGGPAALAGDYVACGCPPKSNVLIAAQGHASAGAMGGGAPLAATMAAGLASGAGGSASQSGNAAAVSAALSSASTNTGAWPASAMPSPTGSLSRGGPSDPYADGTPPHAGDASADDTPQEDTFAFPKAIKRLIDYSPTLKRDLAELKGKGWQIDNSPWMAGDGTYSNKARKLIVLDSNRYGPHDERGFVRALSHEVGHAVSPWREDASSRERYIQTSADEEGWAVFYNLLVRDEIMGNMDKEGVESVDIGFVPDTPQVFDLYITESVLNGESYKAVKGIGQLILPMTPSGEKRSYRDKFNSEYDQLLGQGDGSTIGPMRPGGR